MEKKEILIQALRDGEGLPSVLREHVGEVGACEDQTFDEDYFEWLESEIQKLDSEAPEKAEQLKKRRAALQPFRDVTLLQGSIWTDSRAFNFWVEPETKSVVYWNEWDQEKFKLGRRLIDLRDQYEAFKAKRK